MNFSELIALGKTLIERGENPESIYRSAIRAVKSLCEAGMADEAVSASIYIYNELIKIRETEALNALFHRDTQFLEDYATPYAQPARGNNVAFVLPSGAKLGHADVLERVVAMAKRKPTIITLGKVSEALRAAMPDVVEGPLGTRLQRLHWLHDELTRRQCGTLVWVSGGPMAPFAFASRMAERQAFWAMRYHGMVSEHADLLITSCFHRGRDSRLINSRQWELVPFPWPAAIRAGDASKYRDSFKDWFVFGTVARHEKIAEPAYLQAVAKIINHCPGSLFAWTGAKGYESVAAKLDALIPGRHCFMGWVKCEEAIPSFDVFLETFPLGGVTTAYAMDVGVPAVFMNDSQGICGLAGEGLGVDSVERFVDRAVTLYRMDGARSLMREQHADFAVRNHAMAEQDVDRLFSLLGECEMAEAA